MVGGLDKFKEYFAEYSDQYVLIGGAACDIIMEDFDSSFRVTKDLDLVLIVEALTPEFGQMFWRFVQDGKYRNKSMSTEKPHFYRFDKPEEPEFPYMLELFSRSAFDLNYPESVLTPLHFDDSVSSLSAILLNDAYYEMLVNGRIEIDGVRVLAPAYIIPFKAKAWLDLSEKKQKGIHVDEKDIKKHKNDVVRLATILNDNDNIVLPEEVEKDMKEYIKKYEQSPVDVKSLKIRGVTNEQIVERLKKLYLFV
ncbi:hypothetical protein P261_00542 [Lachnospiraceae bacterium TWA4]|nr:hypothetical protein P261_00542 [Lachnospiraceae bacterium TWA4]